MYKVPWRRCKRSSWLILAKFESTVVLLTTLMIASASMHVGPGLPSELPLSSLDLTEVVYRVPAGSLASVPSSYQPDWLTWLRSLAQFCSDGWRVAHATRGVPAASDARRPG